MMNGNLSVQVWYCYDSMNFIYLILVFKGLSMVPLAGETKEDIVGALKETVG